MVDRVLRLKGPVDLKEPLNRFDLLMDTDPSLRNIQVNGKERIEIPTKHFLGKWIADGQRKTIFKYDLKNRIFIANTSMDPLLSFLMANQAQVKEGSLVLDPFGGSGGLLVACAHFGSYVIGTDINYLLVHGKSKPSRKGCKTRAENEGVLANMVQYGLQSRFLDSFVADASLHKELFHNGAGLFDAIVTDRKCLFSKWKYDFNPPFKI